MSIRQFRIGIHPSLTADGGAYLSHHFLPTRARKEQTPFVCSAGLPENGFRRQGGISANDFDPPRRANAFRDARDDGNGIARLKTAARNACATCQATFSRALASHASRSLTANFAAFSPVTQTSARIGEEETREPSAPAQKLANGR